MITHRGRRATTLCGAAARAFLVEVETADPQLLMARVTGNYKHGMSGLPGIIRATLNHPGSRARRR